MEITRWAPQILAIACGLLVYWKVKGSCDKVYGLIPFVKKRKCGEVKYLNWLLIAVGVACACSCMRLSSRARDFFTPAYY